MQWKKGRLLTLLLACIDPYRTLWKAVIDESLMYDLEGYNLSQCQTTYPPYVCSSARVSRRDSTPPRPAIVDTEDAMPHHLLTHPASTCSKTDARLPGGRAVMDATIVQSRIPRSRVFLGASDPSCIAWWPNTATPPRSSRRIRL
jgi:hypothetical protein